MLDRLRDQRGVILRGWVAIAFLAFVILYVFFGLIQGNNRAVAEGVNILLGSLAATAVLYAFAFIIRGIGAAGKAVFGSQEPDNKETPQ